VGILLLKHGGIDLIESPIQRHRLTETGLRGVDVPLNVTFDRQFRLLGHDAFPSEIAADEPLSLWLYWRDRVPGGPAYRVYPELVDDRGEVWTAFPYWPTEYKPSSSPSKWSPDVYASTAFDLWPLPGTPPGTYTITLTVFDRETLQQFTAYTGSGEVIGPSYTLGQVQVRRPKTPPSLSSFAAQDARIDAVVGPLRLVTARLTPVTAKPGDRLSLEVVWLAERAPKVNLWARLLVESPHGEALDLGLLPLVREDFPTTQWEADDRWRGQHSIRVPARLESGSYSFAVQLCQRIDGRCETFEAPLEIGRVEINTPARVWTVPPLDVTADVQLGEVVTLLGATVTPITKRVHPGEGLEVTLVWRAEAETATDYRVFLHLMSPEGRLVTQSDGVPADWQRPTTGWLPGEIVLDKRTLVLPDHVAPGVYTLVVGMYELHGARLTTPDGVDHVPLFEVEVQE
jgi:hypothetical protein